MLYLGKNIIHRFACSVIIFSEDCKHPQQLDLNGKDGNILQKINKPAKKDLLFLKHRAQASIQDSTNFGAF
jgi:hypothetical protein